MKFYLPVTTDIALHPAQSVTEFTDLKIQMKPVSVAKFLAEFLREKQLPAGGIHAVGS